MLHCHNFFPDFDHLLVFGKHLVRDDQVTQLILVGQQSTVLNRIDGVDVDHIDHGTARILETKVVAANSKASIRDFLLILVVSAQEHKDF